MAKLQSHIAQAIEEAAERLGWSIYKNYSGRGMMGRTCFGITHEVYNEAQMMLKLLLEVKWQDTPAILIEVMEALNASEGSLRSDNLGKQTITYWPHLEWPDEPTDETDDEEEEKEGK